MSIMHKMMNKKMISLIKIKGLMHCRLLWFSMKQIHSFLKTIYE